jgi:hypothetical protein
MTINVALLTNEALILGCDSVASVSTPLLDPFRLEWHQIEPDKSRVRVEFGFEDLQQVVTESWGGVTKMFLLCESPPVAAITSGLAKLNDRTMSDLAQEFRERAAAQPRANVKAVAGDFLRYMRRQYQRHYAASKIPESVRDGPEFLVGGFGRADRHPCLYRIRVKEKELLEQFPPGESGAAWAGQSDAVERLLRGYDSVLRWRVETAVKKEMEKLHKRMTEAMAENLQRVAASLGGTLPDDLELPLPKQQQVSLPWEGTSLSVDFPNLPLQRAVELTAFLVNLQSGKAKYAQGVPTVGGRTHVGVLTKAEGFRMLNEPQLVHRNTGFVDDL